MKLNKKLNKVIALATLVAMSTAVLPTDVMGIDYEGHWAKEAIETWSTNGVLVGFEDGTFRPNDTITRAQLARIITQVFGLSYTKDAKAYTDVKKDAWYADEVAAVSVAGIMNDYEDGTFRPNQMATREEAAYAIARAYKIAVEKEEDGQGLAEKSFADYAQISDWAEDEVAALVAGGVLSGYPDGSFKPQGSLKRSEVVFMFDRITSELIYEEGTYSQDIEGNLVVNTKDVVLSDMTITGNLYLAEGIGEGDVNLNNVTVLGQIIVQGGGVETIRMTGKCLANGITIDKSGDKPVRLHIGSLTEIKEAIVLNSSSIIEGNGIVLPKLVVDGAVLPVVKGKMTINELVVLNAGELQFEGGPRVEKLVLAKEARGIKISAKGERVVIVLVENQAKDVVLGLGVTAIAVKGEEVTEEKRPGGSSGGGGGGNTTPQKEAVKLQGIVLELANGTTKEIQIKDALDIEVDANTKTLKVEGIDISEYTLSKLTFKSNAKDVKFMFNGLEALAITLKTDTSYSIEDLRQIVLGKKTTLIGLVDTFGGHAGLEDTQIKKAKATLDTVFAAISNNKKEVIEVSQIIDWLEKAEIAAEAREHYHSYIKTLDEKLSTISIKGLAKDIKKLELTLSGIEAAATNYGTTYHRINLTYQGK